MFSKSLLILTLCATTGLPSVSVQAVAPSHLQKKEVTKTPEISDEELTKTARKDHAMQLLKDLLNSSSGILDVEERALLISRAADLMWKHDRQFASASIFRGFEDLLSQYKESEVVQSRKKLAQLDISLTRLIATMSRHDEQLSASAIEKLSALRKALLKETATDSRKTVDLSDKEKLSVAQEKVTTDLKKAIELGMAILQNGVPIAFPQFLYDVRRIDSLNADSLYRESLRVLQDGRVYRPAEAIYLSAYGFRERMVLFPSADPDTRRGATPQFGMSTRPLSSADYSLDRQTANSYLVAALGYVTKQLALGSAGSEDQELLLQLTYLATKLSAYSARLGSETASRWQQLKFDLFVRCKNAGIDSATMQHIVGYAERLGNSQQVFHFDDVSSLERAKDIKDEQERIAVLVRGIWNLIQGQHFQQAEMWVKQVDDQKVRDTLIELLEYYAGRASSRERNWNDVRRRASRLKDPRLSSMLLLDAATLAASTASPERETAKEFLLEARAVTARIPSRLDQATRLVSVTALAAETYPELITSLLPEALALINSSEAYDGADDRVLIEVLPNFQVVLLASDSSLEICLRRSAKVDWLSALNVAENLKAKNLKWLAVLSVSTAVL